MPLPNSMMLSAKTVASQSGTLFNTIISPNFGGTDLPGIGNLIKYQFRRGLDGLFDESVTVDASNRIVDIVGGTYVPYEFGNSSSNVATFNSGLEVIPGVDGLEFFTSLSSLKKATRYHVLGRVIEDASGDYRESNEIVIQFDNNVDVSRPDPSVIEVTDVDNDSAIVSWTSEADATNSVEYATDATFDPLTSVEAPPGASPSVTLTGLTPNTLYHVRVRSTDLNGNSGVESPTTGSPPGTFMTDSADPHGRLQLLRTIISTNGLCTIAGCGVDSEGDIAVVGVLTGSASLGLPGSSQAQMSSVGGSASSDGFVAKFNQSGILQWHRQIGSSSGDYGHAIVVDSLDNVIIAGRFQGTINCGGSDLVSAGSSDVFVAKYTSAGVHVWSKRFGGPGSDIVEQGNAIAVDSSNNVLLGIKFQGTADIGGTNIVSAGSDDCGLAKLNGANGATLWAKRFGSTNIDVLRGVAVDKDDNVVVIGYFFATTNLGGGALTAAGGVNDTDIFVGKYLGTDGSFVWGKRFGNTLGDNGQGITTDPVSGNIIITGLFKSTVSFGGPAPLDSFSNGGIFLVGLDPDGVYLWGKATGSGSTVDLGLSVKADSAHILLTGKASSGVYFGGTQTLLGNGQPNWFLASFMINPDARDAEPAYRWAKMVGEGYSGASQGNQVAFHPSGSVAICGSFIQQLNFGGTTVSSTPGFGAGFVALYTN